MKGIPRKKLNKSGFGCLGLYLAVLIFSVSCTKYKSSGEGDILYKDNNITEQRITDNIIFKILKTEEIFKHEIERINEERYLKIYNSTNNELVKVKIPYSRNYDNEIQYNKTKRRMVIQCKPNSPNIFELWFIDGDNGIAKKLLESSFNYSFKIDDDCIFICLDASNNEDVPKIEIFNIQEMKIIKIIKYEPYRYKGMYPVDMSYKEESFIVKLSVDTVDYTTIKIPIYGSEEYQVIESYSWGKNK
jgi:hypothetical protein